MKCHSFIYLDLILEVLLVTLFEYSSTTQGGLYLSCRDGCKADYYCIQLKIEQSLRSLVYGSAIVVRFKPHGIMGAVYSLP